MKEVKILLLLAGAMATATCVAAEPPPVEKRLGNRPVLLPQLSGFPAACEENKALAERAAGLTPNTSEFLTCFVEAGKWKKYLAGQYSDLYPYIAVTTVHPHPSGPYSVADFEELKKAAHSQLGDLVANVSAAKARLKEQDEKLKASGTELKRENYLQNLAGLFEVPGDMYSFSYLVIRSTTVHEGTKSRQLCETNAVSTILFEGRLLGLMVVDACSTPVENSQVREITGKWVHAFREANISSR